MPDAPCPNAPRNNRTNGRPRITRQVRRLASREEQGGIDDHRSPKGKAKPARTDNAPWALSDAGTMRGIRPERGDAGRSRSCGRSLCQDRVQGRTQSEPVSPMNHKGLQILWLNKVQAAGKAGQDHPQTEDIRQRIAPCRRLSMGRHLGSGRLAGAQQTENRNTQPSPQGRLGHLPRQWQLNSSHFHGTREKRAFCFSQRFDNLMEKLSDTGQGARDQHIGDGRRVPCGVGTILLATPDRCGQAPLALLMHNENAEIRHSMGAGRIDATTIPPCQHRAEVARRFSSSSRRPNRPDLSQYLSQ